MTLRPLIARHPGKCDRCGNPFGPGASILYGGRVPGGRRGYTYHVVGDCPDGGGGNGKGANDSTNPYEADRFASVSIFRNGDGEVIGTRNRNGTCEDAPCCGCCS